MSTTTSSRTLAPVAEAVTLMPPAGHSFADPAEDGYAEAVHETMRAWHNETHPGAFQSCTEQPCDAIKRLS
ncbi:MAG TPA: hypothetical protein VF642_12415 [Propionibacteriaceae bacterium]|jgi:hypothetical protein